MESYSQTWTEGSDCHNCCLEYYYVQDQYDYEKARDEKHNAPMPWIGLYVAAASLICVLAMAADVFLGFRHKKLWFPSKYFTLNAASLTLLAIAMKLTVDLSTDMPGVTDQYAKITSIVFMCTVISNFTPYLGQMNNRDIFMNMTALGILVVTIFVNICIQLKTGIVDGFIFPFSLIYSLIMLVLFVIMTSSSLYVPSTRKYIDLRYHEIHRTISNEESSQIRNLNVDKLKEDVKRYWMMAQTGSPQFVMARSTTCIASGAICCMTALFVSIIVIHMLNIGDSRTNSSSYKWSTYVILVVQTSGICLGIIVCAFRLFITIKLQFSGLAGKSFKTMFRMEKYWTEMLVEWKEKPLPLNIRGQKWKKLVHNAKNMLLCSCIKVQIAIVVVSKLIQILFILLTSPLSLCYLICKQFFLVSRKLVPSLCASRKRSGLGLETIREMELSCHVLLLEGENELPKRMLNHISTAMDRLVQNGRKQHPQNLKELICKSSGFKGVAEFDSEEVPSLGVSEPPNSWMMSVVTLTSIAIALPNIENQMVEQMLRSVNEGLIFTRLLEKTLDGKGDFKNIGAAAEVTWLGVELNRKWMDKDLQKLASKESSKGTLEHLANIAKKNVSEFTEKANEIQKNPLNWPVKVVAANSMYRISRTLLLGYNHGNEQTSEELFARLSIMISDILAACLTNLPHVITSKCFCNVAEKREESIQQAAHLFGETEEILKVLQQRELPSLNQDQVANIDEWRAVIKREHYLASVSSSNNGIASPDHGEMHIAIE